MVIWAIWETRNGVVWHNKRPTPVRVIHRAKGFLDDWTAVRVVQRKIEMEGVLVSWTKPH